MGLIFEPRRAQRNAEPYQPKMAIGLMKSKNMAQRHAKFISPLDHVG
jgi:hypothetical protein